MPPHPDWEALIPEAIPRIRTPATNMEGGADVSELVRWAKKMPSMSTEHLRHIYMEIMRFADTDAAFLGRIPPDVGHGIYKLARTIRDELLRRREDQEENPA